MNQRTGLLNNLGFELNYSGLFDEPFKTTIKIIKEEYLIKVF